MKLASAAAQYRDPVQRIATYAVERLLGLGGSGEVYSVHDPERGCSIALKLLPRRVMESRPELVPAFRREYHRLQLLRHPRIVQAYDFGSAEAGLYYTMELVEGPDLKTLVPLAWQQTCSLLRDVALSLAIVHSRRLLHRDVGPGNVRCTQDGRAKLIDFGATVSMGIPSSIVGTPPCVPPEAIDRQALDARSDLFGLGALGYFLLTGEHAYPAAGLSQLHAAWQVPPAPPSARAPGTPEALDRLILSLLQLDRRLRPGSAVEVIHHLEALAGLPAVAPSEAAQSSLVAPALAGRSAELDVLGRSLAAARSGHGASVLIEAAPGLGRTRLLNQFVIDASQSDVLVAAVHPGRASVLGDEAPPRSAGALPQHDGCRSLCEAILRQLPLRCDESLDRHNAALSALFSQLQRPVVPSELSPHTQGTSARGSLLPSLQSELLALSERVTLVVLVDDLQLCDEASADLFASLAASARDHHLLVVATRQIGAQVVAVNAVQSMSQHAGRVLLRPLDLHSIEELVRSTFVGAPQVKRVAEWASTLSDGNPAKVVELLRYLVERDIVRFGAGAWFLPEQIAAHSLPGAMAEALRARIDSLSPTAREVAELVCVSAYPQGLETLRQMLAAPVAELQVDEPLLRALDELSAAGVVTADEQGYVIACPALAKAVLEGMSAEHLRQTHLRLGRGFCADAENVAYDRRVDLQTAFSWSLAGYHLLRGGERRLGAELWCHGARYTFEVDHVAMWDGNSWYREGNLLAIDAVEELGMPAIMLARLRVTLAQVAVHGDCQFVVHGERAIEELEPHAGTSVGASSAATGIRPFEAILLLVSAVFSTACIYAHTIETNKLAKLPAKLEPFAGLNIAMAVLRDLTYAMLAGASGRTDVELRIRREGLPALVAMETQPGSSPTGVRHLRGFSLHCIALIEATRNPRLGLRRADQLEAEAPFMQYGAWQVRLLAHIQAADAAQAAACAERMEMVAVLAGATKSQLYGCGLLYLADAYASTGDVMGLRATIEQIRPFAERMPNWQPIYDAACAQYQRLCGQLDEARALAERAASKLRPGQHRSYAFATIALLCVLLDAEDPRAARKLQREALEHTRAHALGPEFETQLRRLGAQADAKLGDLGGARLQIDAAIALARAADFSGVPLGDLHLCAAQISLLQADRKGYGEHAALFVQHACAHEHPAMMARYERLLAETAQMSCVDASAHAGTVTVTRTVDFAASMPTEID